LDSGDGGSDPGERRSDCQQPMQICDTRAKLAAFGVQYVAFRILVTNRIRAISA